MLKNMLIDFEEWVLLLDRRAVTFLSFRVVELVVKINARFLNLHNSTHR
jgi:hypothetical protein